MDNAWAVVGHQLRAGLEALAVRGTWGVWPADHYGDPTPLLDPWTGGLLAIGAVAILLRTRSSSGVLLTTWLLLGILLSAGLTVDNPDPGRMLALLPAFIIVASLVLDELWRGASHLYGRMGEAVFAVPVVVVLGLVLHANVDDYFRAFPQHQPATPLTLASTYAARIGSDYRIYMIGSGNWTLDSELPRFLAPNADAANVKDRDLELPLERIPHVKGVAFVVEGNESDAELRLAPIRSTYPGGYWRRYADQRKACLCKLPSREFHALGRRRTLFASEATSDSAVGLAHTTPPAATGGADDQHLLVQSTSRCGAHGVRSGSNRGVARHPCGWRSASS